MLFRDEVVAHRANRLHGEVVLSQPLSTRLLVLALVAIMLGAGTWITLGSYARIERAPGILVTSRPSAKVVASVPGLVTALDVEEGSLVHKGDRLATITLDRRAESGASFSGDGLAAIGSRMALSEAQVGLAGARLASERARLGSVIAAAEAQRDRLAGQIELQSEVVASNRDLFDQIAKVVERGFVSKIEYERRRQTLLNARQSLGTLVQQQAASAAEAAQARAQLAGLAADSATQVNDIQSSMQALAQQRAQLQGEQGYVVSAPIAGRVTALQTAKGRAATGQAPLMIIVPEGSDLRAEIYAPSRAIGFVRPGQETRLLFDAFPYQRFGSFGGRIASVSRIVIDPRESEVPLKLEEPVYRVTVALDRQRIEAFGEAVPLQPGMTLQANIVLERQSFLDWLLTPLRAVWRRS